ncbi:hypothetical protein OG889_01940 [Streptomyces sp. NBC_00481]|nr:hypothetical protein OG889_01940 [Streptomyces sp. NBC_00481]
MLAPTVTRRWIRAYSDLPLPLPLPLPLLVCGPARRPPPAARRPPPAARRPPPAARRRSSGRPAGRPVCAGPGAERGDGYDGQCVPRSPSAALNYRQGR